jgi:small subunit ribosomal protein S16
MLRKHLQIGVIKGAISQEQADGKLSDWLKDKETKLSAHSDKISQSKQAQAKARMEAETKVKEARAEAIRKKSIVEEAPVADEAAAEESNENAAGETPEAQA